MPVHVLPSLPPPILWNTVPPSRRNAVAMMYLRYSNADLLQMDTNVHNCDDVAYSYTYIYIYITTF